MVIVVLLHDNLPIFDQMITIYLQGDFELYVVIMTTRNDAVDKLLRKCRDYRFYQIKNSSK